MSTPMTPDPYPAKTGQVVADPKRPWKALAAGLVAFLGLVWANLQGVEDWATLDLQDWVTILVPTALTILGTYLVPNPQTYRDTTG